MMKLPASLLPKPRYQCLLPITPAEVAQAYVAAQKQGRCAKDQAIEVLASLLPAEPALAAAAREGRILEQGGFVHAEGAFQSPSAVAWGEIKRALAFRVLGAGPDGGNGKRSKRDLAAVALRQVYGLENLSPSPSRAEVRCELVRRVIASLGDPYTTNATKTPKAFKFDAMSRNVYLALAGLASGSVLEADAALLSSALGDRAGTIAELSATIIRKALSAGEAEAQVREEAFDLDGFAESIKELARTLETKPYSGRVAIAQVYDAGLECGLPLGSLEEFKSHLAEAAREGKLDLERYDITGPLDANLKERSRLRLGRDERHFIVNQWI